MTARLVESDPPDAIAAMSDELAAGAVAAVRKAGLRVPSTSPSPDGTTRQSQTNSVSPREPELWDALRAVALDHWVAALPDGLDTIVGEDGDLISGGQRQRITLARALISDARYLVLDEPTAQLDADTATIVMRGISEAAGDRGLLVISHRHEGLEDFDLRRLSGGQLARS
jgi:ABC-type transport system involved in cytochrome bd biosynthesis fused ATPase/permease subunit